MLLALLKRELRDCLVSNMQKLLIPLSLTLSAFP